MDIAVCRLLVVLSLMALSAGLEVIDMTLVLGTDTILWPGSPPFNFTILERGNQSDGYWYEINYFGTAEHAGTHVDAPAHFSQSGWRVHQIPPSSFAGPAVVVNVADKATKDADYRLIIEDLQAWEDRHGRIPNKAVVVMDSGWGVRYPNSSRVFNTNNPLNVSTFHFPGIHPAAAAWLASQRHVIAVGVDTPSTDYGQSTKYETHVVLGNNNVLGLENLQNVDQLPARGATITIGLVNLKDGSGGPARILAITDSTCTSTTGGGNAPQPTALLFLWIIVSVFMFQSVVCACALILVVMSSDNYLPFTTFFVQAEKLSQMHVCSTP